MSSDDYFFGNDTFDDAALAEVEAIEAAALAKAATPATAPPKPQAARPQPRPLAADSSIDMTFDIDESELAALDEMVAQEYSEKVLGVPGPSKRPMMRTSSSAMLQTTLFGDILPTQTSNNKPKSAATPGPQKSKSTGPRNLFGQQAPKTKIWDPSTFDEDDFRKKIAEKGKMKKKGKGKAASKADDDDEDEDAEDYVLMPPKINRYGRSHSLSSRSNSSDKPPPMKLKPDLLEAKHWIFPINRPKRDYQYNIVQKCLFDNTLVALPTGLGKTFVAGVVMLNYYRWFPEGKIIFVAPTRPLVGQQIIASHETCGIPGTEAIELTGQVKAPTRARYWQEKRVFYMTPQTLESDLASGACDPMDVILLVIDEAHHGTGGYSYSTVVKFMTAKNPNFRVLALTATPGNSPEAVQKLIDGLHISKIEMRSEKSLDLRPYIFEKVVHSHLIKPTGDVLVVQELLKEVMDPIFLPLQKAGMFSENEKPLTMHPFRPQMILQDKKHPLAAKSFTPLMHLSTLSRAVMYLQAGSISSCRAYLASRRTEDIEKNRKNGLSQNSKFQDLMKKMDEFAANGCTPHPKMEKLKDILVKYFGSRIRGPNEEGAGEPDDSRVMVFSSYRAVVEEIIVELNQHRPLVRAAAFVGQARSQDGTKGLTQKQQTELVERFKRGEFNVLVATSIGEEGLDIGEINCTVCYDTDKAPIRMVQRFGRTGRKRAGEVHVLLAESREENNLDKAKGMYEEVQKVIDRGTLYELYGDVPRLLPDRIKPECVERVMEMQHYIREEPRKAKGSGAKAAKGTKRKRSDPDNYVPPDLGADFTSAASVWKGFPKEKKKTKVAPLPKDPKALEALGEDDDTDREIESGTVLNAVRRTQSDKVHKKKASSPAPLSRRSKTATTTEKVSAKDKKKRKDLAEKPWEELLKEGEDDDVDEDLERDVFLAAFKPASKLRTSGSSSKPLPKTRAVSETLTISDSEEDKASLDGDVRKSQSRSKTPESPPRRDEFEDKDDMGWLVEMDDDEDEDELEVRDNPEPARMPSPHFDRIQVEEDSIEISQAFPSQRNGKNKNGKATRVKHRSSSPIEIVEAPAVLQSLSFRPASKVSFAPEPSSSKVAKRKTNMSPPPVPTPSRPSKGPIDFSESPEPTFPVLKPAKRRRLATITSSDCEDDEDTSRPAQQRLHRRHAESTPVKPKKKSREPKAKKISLLDKVQNHIMDGEAAHSGDEVSEGDSEDEEERSSDREFLKDSPSMTQASPSYEQTQMYRQSLFTQAPMGADAPVFRRGISRPKPFGRIDPSFGTRRYLPSSSPPPPDEELDEYEHGSFIVPDGDVTMDASSDDPLLDF